MIEKPTGSELWYEEVGEEVHRESDPSWRHGTYEYRVWHREEDDTYWAASFQLQTDGEYCSLRDDPGSDTITQVWPVDVVKTVREWVSNKPEEIK